MAHPRGSVSSVPVRFLPVLAGASLFFSIQYARGLFRLAAGSGEMKNKFSAVAREEYLGFLVARNLEVLVAYVLLSLLAAVCAMPVLGLFARRPWFAKRGAMAAGGLGLAAAMHAYCTLRLVDTRPYFLSEAYFGHWYHRILDLIPAPAVPAGYWILFTLLPVVFLLWVGFFHIRRWGRAGGIAVGCAGLIVAGTMGFHAMSEPPALSRPAGEKPMNILIIGSDSLRGDRLGVAGYRPVRTDGAAAAGVSPAIDGLAARSIVFERCYTSIASTLESGTSLMTSQYPRTHGLRQMYPDRETVERAKRETVPMASLLSSSGYDTAAIGDWCAGFYELMPLGFRDVSVSSFDNFKIYMSQAVMMAHFVIPLYFDNPLGYRLFPQINSFAQFVTPEVVTRRVEKRLAGAARNGRPFFWHVFYSCNHLPYRTPEPYCSMFSDPAYAGPNRSGVDFDIDSFIGGTDLESKWRALPEEEVDQIRALYDGATRNFDDCVKRILDALDRYGLADDTIVIITSDHGDDLYEPGVTLGHGLTLHGGGQANHVPMIIHIPGREPRVISETVRVIDLMPTLADVIGMEKPEEWEGESFAGWIEGGEMPEWRPFYAETGFPFIQFRVPGVERPALPPMDELTFIDESFNYQFVLKPEYEDRLVAAKQYSLQTRDWKIVRTPTVDGSGHYGLFHLPGDPHGERDLAPVRPEVLRSLREALDLWIDQGVETGIPAIFPAGEPEGDGG